MAHFAHPLGGVTVVSLASSHFGEMAVGLLALAHTASWPLMLIFALGGGSGFGMIVLAVSILLLNYYGRRNNREIFSLVCLMGAVSALGSRPAAQGDGRGYRGAR